jgi:cytoskeletal protein RodZ
VVAGAFAVLGVASFVGVKLVQRPDSLPAQARSTAQVTQTATPPVGSTVSPAQPTAQTPAPVESAAAPVAASAKPAGTPMLVGKQPVAVRSGPAINTAPPKPTSTGTPQKPPPPKDPLHL